MVAALRRSHVAPGTYGAAARARDAGCAGSADPVAMPAAESAMATHRGCVTAAVD
jgi:hypothetical protein